MLLGIWRVGADTEQRAHPFVLALVAIAQSASDSAAATIASATGAGTRTSPGT